MQTSQGRKYLYKNSPRKLGLLQKEVKKRLKTGDLENMPTPGSLEQEHGDALSVGHKAARKSFQNLQNKLKTNPHGVVRDTTEQYNENDLQELGAQGWKNVATGAKVADAASTALAVGSILAAPFTAGVSLTGLGAAAALKGGTKLATTAVTKGAAKMATKAATKASTTAATKASTTAATKGAQKTFAQKAKGVGKRIAGDVATYAAYDAISGGGRAQQSPSPTAPQPEGQSPSSQAPSYSPNQRVQQPQKLAASYNPEGEELAEFVGKMMTKLRGKGRWKGPKGRFARAGAYAKEQAKNMAPWVALGYMQRPGDPPPPTAQPNAEYQQLAGNQQKATPNQDPRRAP